MSNEKGCEHHYQFLYSEYESTEGSFRDHYTKKDIFFCSRCLDYREKLVKSETSRGRPSWYTPQ